MPSGRKLCNGHLYFLSSYTRTSTRGIRFTSAKRPLASPTQCLSLRLRSRIVQHAVPFRALGSNVQATYIGNRKQESQEFSFSNGDRRDQDLVRELDIQNAYHKLRQIALGGNYFQIQACVKILVKERGEQPNIRLYEALLLANADHEHGSASETASILEEMTKEGMAQGAATYHAVLRVLAVHPDYLLRYQICHELRQRWFSLTKDGWHDVVTGLMKDRQVELALDALEQLWKEGIRVESWLYDMMIYSLCSAEEFDAALNIMEHRISDGDVNISPTTWYHLLDTGSCALHHSVTLFAYRSRVETSYLNPPAGMCINILNTAARHADTYLATSVLRILGRRSGNAIQLHHYEALLDTYVATDDIRTALTLLTIMTAAGYIPTEASTRSIFHYLCKSATLPAKAISILEHLHEQDRQVPVQAANAIMQASIFHRNLPAALSLYKNLHSIGLDLKPDTASFNILFRGCAQAARKDLAMFLASEMVALKVTPDALTYDRLILVCLNSEDSLEDAWRYFEEINGLGWWPRDGTLSALARRACEQGDRRVWKLEQKSNSSVLSRLKLQSLIKDHWRGGVEEARLELNRGR